MGVEEGLTALGLRMVPIPAGRFTRGEEQSGSAQDVGVSTFELADAPVTVAAYRAYLEATDRHPRHQIETWDGAWRPGPSFAQANAAGEDHAVVGVSHRDALDFLAWAGGRCATVLRLPTEAEFEYAARANCGCTGPQCATAQSRPLPAEVSGPGPRLCPWPVRTGPAGGFGLWDMHGHVWQWCSDWYAPHERAATLEDPTGPPDPPATTLWNGLAHAAGRVIRGGSYAYPNSFSACGHRHFSAPGDRNTNLGFRVARSRTRP
jgi:formylglycine-generating enzyme required for sulfatase activity